MNVESITVILVLSSNFSPATLLTGGSEETARNLRLRYIDNVNVCKDRTGADTPAYHCSGIIMRGVHKNLALAWSISPRSKAMEAVSFAFLRQDAQWSTLTLEYTSGIILYPNRFRPQGKQSYIVYCAFPLDADTWDRASPYACGKSPRDTKGQGGDCETQGITTFTQWKNHFDAVSEGEFRTFHRNQCTFDMTKKSAPQLFRTVLDAHEFLRTTNNIAYYNNELMISAWDENNPKSLPIEAFFYLKGDPDAKKRAFRFLEEYKNYTGQEVPIVELQLPGPTKTFEADPSKNS